MSTEDSIRIIESAIAIIVAWASRREFHDEAMRRARCNLSRGGAALLNKLNTCGPLRVGELATILGVENSTITPQAQRLERAGFVTREPDATDGRAAMLVITPAGRSVLDNVQRSRREMLLERLRDWPDADRAAIASALTRLASAL
ncbi:MAG TPA: MarR family transcriptional regulator [Jatrophihabitans sp.]|nr:MarR family transcriptional regulator [Jatrophihabitans sp.]